MFDICLYLCTRVITARNYKNNFGDSVTECKRLSVKEKRRRLNQITEDGVQRKAIGNPNFKNYLKYDERALLADYLEVCHFLHLPFNVDSFRGLVAAIATANGHKNPVVSRCWIKAFMEEFKHLGFYKVSNISIARAKQATAKVRDAHFGKLQALLDRLVKMRVLTDYERNYELDKLSFYMDEQGGGTEKTKKKVIGTKQKNGMQVCKHA